MDTGKKFSTEAVFNPLGPVSAAEGDIAVSQPTRLGSGRSAALSEEKMVAQIARETKAVHLGPAYPAERSITISQPTQLGSGEPAVLSGKELAAQIARETKVIRYVEDAVYAFVDRKYEDALRLIEKVTKPTHYALAVKAHTLMQLPGRDEEGKAMLAHIKAQPSLGVEDDIGKAWLYLQDMNAEEAIRHADLVLAKENHNFRAYRIRGEAKAWQGSYNEAIEDYTLAIACNTHSALAYYFRAISLRKSDLSQRIDDLGQATKLRPDFSLARDSLHEACHQRASERFNEGDYAGARDDYTQILALNPQDIMAYNNRGMLWKLEGNFGEAQKDFLAGLDIAPENDQLRERLRKLLPLKPPRKGKGPASEVVDVQVDNQVSYPYKQARKMIKVCVEHAEYKRIDGLLKALVPSGVAEEEARVTLSDLRGLKISNMEEIITKLAVQKGSLSK